MTQVDELTVNRPGWKTDPEPTVKPTHPSRWLWLDAGDGRFGYVLVDSYEDKISVSAREGWHKYYDIPLKTFNGVSQTNLDAALDLVEQHLSYQPD